MREWFRKLLTRWVKSTFAGEVLCPTPYTIRVSTDGKNAYLQGNSDGVGVRLWYFLDDCQEEYSDIHALDVVAFYKEAGESTKLHPWKSADLDL